jgi:diphosphomevalonate decarboxylase
MKRVTTRAFANIALAKYWGKRPGFNNIPATPSISLALEKLKTETDIEKSVSDSFFINGFPVDSLNHKRLKTYLDFWRKQGLIEGNFSVKSFNDFPTGAGLASSSSGFAALALALSAFSKRKISRHSLSRLARIGSGSAARSIIGGLAALPSGQNPAARLLIDHDKIPWGMVIAIVKAGTKEIGSRQGMELCRKYSPYYKSWVKQAFSDYKRMLKAIEMMDFTAIGEIAESNALAMHACMTANRPALLYWSSATVNLIKTVQGWRHDNLETYATIDAGPHVALFARKKDLSRIAERAKIIEGVESIIESNPAGGAEIIEWS